MSNGNSSPAEIARETLRKLAAERLQPTPDNFRTQYHLIAGTVAEDVFPGRTLGTIVGDLPRSNPQALKVAGQLERAVASGQWPALRSALHDLARQAGSPPPAWGRLVREIVDGLEESPSNQHPAQRRSELLRVLGNGQGDAQALFARLRGLANGWTSGGKPDREETTTSSGGGSGNERLAPALARLIWRGLMPIASGHAHLADELDQLALALGQPIDDDTLASLVTRIETLAARLEWLGEDHLAIREGLLGLLRLIVENVGELVIDDSWLHGQIAAIAGCLDGPIDIRKLDDVERRLTDVIAKQTQLKKHLHDAHARLQAMLAGFLERLAGMTATTGSYQETLGRCARAIADANDIDELSSVIESVLSETQAVHETTRRASDDMADLQAKVEEANARIASLQKELDETSDLVRHDALTGVLNRRGIDEAMTQELSRCRRRGEPVCLAVLDVDGFKQVNDNFGHHVGDAALQHLVQVVRECLRPQDLVGRYGGEEFVIVLPEAVATQSAAVLTRLQRELTKRYFLADNQRLLITFSAGVAQVGDTEEAQLAVDRADRAMYAAKRAGKNRVLVAG